MNGLKLILILLYFITFQTTIAQDKGMGKLIVPTNADGTPERRLALIVGNKDYSNSEATLKNPINDATDMGNMLKKLGFTVILKTNLNRIDFEKAIDEFGKELSNYDVGLFYYSGHGIQAQGENYLIPIDASSIEAEPMIKYKCVDFGRVLASMEGSSAQTNIAILDACRSNPYKKSWSLAKGDGQQVGFTIPNNPPGSCVIFATSAGRTADDNPSARNGLFTESLLKIINIPNLSLASILTQTRNSVFQKSNRTQLPEEHVKLLGDFYFIKSVNPIIPNVVIPKTDLPLMDMVYIRGGSFEMGSNEGESDEKPVHAVTVSSFQMGKYEVTVGQFGNFVSETNYVTDAEKSGGSYIWNGTDKKWELKEGLNWRYNASGRKELAAENHPVIHVSHNDAMAFCRWLSKKEGNTYRLPTEAEWEYAAGHGVEHTKYSWGNSNPAGKAGNVADETGAKELNWSRNSTNIFLDYTDGFVYTSPVGSFSPNGYGLFDMTGNVWEWCSDWYGADYYANSSSTNPTGPNTGSFRVLRGGSWDTYPSNSRVANRYGNTPVNRSSYIGFRVVSPQ